MSRQYKLLKVDLKYTMSGKPTCMGCRFRYISEDRDPMCFFRYEVEVGSMDAMSSTYPNRPGPKCPLHGPKEAADAQR